MLRNWDFDHDGIACHKIEEDIKYYQSLGFEISSDLFEDPNQDIRGLFMTIGNYKVELLEPLSEKSPLKPFLDRKIKIYHHAFQVENIEECIEDLIKGGNFLTSPPKISVYFQRPIAFVTMRNSVLIELINAK